MKNKCWNIFPTKFLFPKSLVTSYYTHLATALLDLIVATRKFKTAKRRSGTGYKSYISNNSFHHNISLCKRLRSAFNRFVAFCAYDNWYPFIFFCFCMINTIFTCLSTSVTLACSRFVAKRPGRLTFLACNWKDSELKLCVNAIAFWTCSGFFFSCILLREAWHGNGFRIFFQSIVGKCRKFYYHSKSYSRNGKNISNSFFFVYIIRLKCS